MLINKNALVEKDTLHGDTKFLILDPNSKQKNAGNETITWDNIKAEVASESGSFTDVITTTDTTDSTSKDTGSIITEGGVGIEKSLFAGLTINSGTTMSVGTALNVGTDQTFTKEVNHTISISASTTAATAGGDLTITSGAGNGAAGGAITVKSPNETGTDPSGYITIVSGDTVSADSAGVDVYSGTVATLGNSGAVTISSGISTTSGNSGAATLQTGAVATGDSGNAVIVTGSSTVGGTGDVTLTTGNTASGLAGDVIIQTGTSTSATVCPVVNIKNGLERQPGNSSVASGATITAVELVKGHITGTGATGNWQLPSAANLITAFGSVTVGTNFEFVFNAATMTATNTATLVVGASMTVASAPAITGGGALTVTQDTQVTGGFRIVFDTLTTCKIYRIW